jgi:hypothetical protein
VKITSLTNTSSSQSSNELWRYGEIADIIVVVVDVDCEDGERKPRNKPLAVRNAIGECPKHKEKVVVVMAIQELETWALWGERASLGVPWGTVLEECDPKEVSFEPLLTPVDRESADRGRKRLIAKTLAGGWQSFRSGCSEIADLEDQIRELL